MLRLAPAIRPLVVLYRQWNNFLLVIFLLTRSIRVEGGELFDRVIDDEFMLSERACTVLVRQLCQAMEFVHRNNIIHLDLKPENILCLSREGNRIKIIDFGLARRFDPEKKLQVSGELCETYIWTWTLIPLEHSYCNTMPEWKKILWILFVPHKIRLVGMPYHSCERKQNSFEHKTNDKRTNAQISALTTFNDPVCCV